MFFLEGLINIQIFFKYSSNHIGLGWFCINLYKKKPLELTTFLIKTE